MWRGPLGLRFAPSRTWSGGGWNVLGPASPEPRVRGGELDPVEQNHGLRVDPHEKDDDRSKRANRILEDKIKDMLRP